VGEVTTYRIICSDALAALQAMPDNSIDSYVVDPPAGIGFMGKGWDGDKGGYFQWIGWLAEIMREALRVIKPGGHALVWALPRTSHWTGMALEMAGWEIRDRLSHIFGTGFPKSLNIGDGKGTALKPAVEDWWLCRKPLSSTVAGTVLEWGTGALNVDACRVDSPDAPDDPVFAPNAKSRFDGVLNGGKKSENEPRSTSATSAGRWPPHLLLSHGSSCTETECAPDCPVLELGRQGERAGSHAAGHVTDGKHCGGTKPSGEPHGGIYGEFQPQPAPRVGDSGSVARFFPTFRYSAKPSTAEKSAGLDNSELIIVEWLSWENEVQKVTLRVDTAKSPPRVTVVSGTQNKSASEWSMWLFGSSSTAPSLMDTRSTIGMESSSITKSKTLNWLHRWFTKGFTVDASLGTESGGSLAGSAEPSTPWITITSDTMEFPPGVESVAAKTPVRITSKGNRTTHPTVKSLDLMRWLVRLITPEGGTGMDFFGGSGTTGIAYLLEEFSVIVVEKEEEYADLARQRIRHWAPMWASEGQP